MNTFTSVMAVADSVISPAAFTSEVVQARDVASVLLGALVAGGFVLGGQVIAGRAAARRDATQAERVMVNQLGEVVASHLAVTIEEWLREIDRVPRFGNRRRRQHFARVTSRAIAQINRDALLSIPHTWGVVNSDVLDEISTLHKTWSDALQQAELEVVELGASIESAVESASEKTQWAFQHVGPATRVSILRASGRRSDRRAARKLRAAHEGKRFHNQTTQHQECPRCGCNRVAHAYEHSDGR